MWRAAEISEVMKEIHEIVMGQVLQRSANTSKKLFFYFRAPNA